MTARTHETIRVGLRKIIRDANVTAKLRLQAIQLLMNVEGLMESDQPKPRPIPAIKNHANLSKIRELLDAESKETVNRGYPAISSSANI